MNSLRLGHSLEILRPSLHNGPGWRIAFWTQGCRRPCTDQCLSPHLLDPAGGCLFAVADVVAAIRRTAAQSPWPVEGVTALGGEPFDQAAAVAAVLRPLQAAGLSSMVYSGQTLEHLRGRRDPDVEELLAATDLLVDGPFLPDRYDEHLAWRGSSNQRLLCLTSRYTPRDLEQAFAAQGKGFSIEIAPGRLSVSGPQSRRISQQCEEIFAPPVTTVTPRDTARRRP